MALSHEEFLAARKKAYSGVDRDMYLDIGFFIAWYAQAELALTAVLAASVQISDLATFDMLCKGMDARVKIDRLRKSAKRHGGIGPNISARLKLFEERVTPLRNKVAHSSITFSEDDKPRRYWLSGLANLPWEELGLGPRKTDIPPYEVSSRDIYSCGVWLSFFAMDMSSLQRLASARKQLELDAPRSRILEEGGRDSQRKSRSSKSDTGDQLTP